MELRVNDYVRTKYGITQFKEYETTNGEKLLCMPVKDGSQGIFANIEDVVKSSPNIIDLIEVGDYVNGLYVHGITDYGLEVYMFGDAKEYLKEDEIKTIVTKKQFKNMEYEVE